MPSTKKKRRMEKMKRCHEIIRKRKQQNSSQNIDENTNQEKYQQSPKRKKLQEIDQNIQNTEENPNAIKKQLKNQQSSSYNQDMDSSKEDNFSTQSHASKEETHTMSDNVSDEDSQIQEDDHLPDLIIEKEQPQAERKIISRRIIDVIQFFTKIQEISCHGVLNCGVQNLKIIGENRVGLASTFTVKCLLCNEKFYIKNVNDELDINTAAVSGAISIGIGYSQFEELLSALDLPMMTESIYQKRHDTVSNSWEKALTKSMKEAAEEEKRIALEKGRVSKDGFPVIDVIVDGCWSGFYCKRCLMLGASTQYMPALANESLPEEASKLQNHLQRQLEEDIARIFDESIYPDLEIVCGKLKILTHSCILQARTNRFFHKLTTVFNLALEKKLYDEVYSFISDAYTECNIKHQEEQIIEYLQSHLSNLPISKRLLTTESNFSVLYEGEDSVVDSKKKYKPYTVKDFLKVQFESGCDPCGTLKFRIETQNKNIQKVPENFLHSNKETIQISGDNNCKEQTYKSQNNNPIIDSVISSDSLLTEEPSSLSDNFSSINTYIPGLNCDSQLNDQYHSTMENNISLSDSGLESNGFLESNISSHKDVTLPDNVLEEITSCSTILDEATSSAYPSFTETNLHDSTELFSASQLDPVGKTDEIVVAQKPCHNKIKEGFYKSSKEEKQRQNEEIVILESSSISSETGSWESVFPPKLAPNSNKKCLSIEPHQPKSENQKNTPFTTSCFIDAASLVEPEYEVQISGMLPTETKKPDVLKLSQPIPCSSAKVDASPNDWSEANENDDSLEQCDKNDFECDQKNMSPTIFEMTPISDDIPCNNTFENVSNQDYRNPVSDPSAKTEVPFSKNTSNATISKAYNSGCSHSEHNSLTFHSSENLCTKVSQRYNESSPIVSGGASVVDHLPQTRSQTHSPHIRRKMENLPKTCDPCPTEDITTKQYGASAWVVDMSTIESEANDSFGSNNIRGGKTHSENQSEKIHVESDSSEKSGHNFFIDLRSLPDSVSDQNETYKENSSEKKNIFSMYIDFGNKPPVKDMPARLSSSFNVKKTHNDAKTNKIKISKISMETHPQTNEEPNESIIENENTADNTFVFEEYETLCSNPDISISEIINLASSDFSSELVNKENESKKTLECDGKEDKILSEKPDDLFVKLSDLDKPVSKPVETFTSENTQPDVRMTRSIPENDWEDQVVIDMPRSIEVMSSFHSENALSLNRLFPHLRNELSRSMPGSLSGRMQFPLRVAAASSLDVNEQAHDASELSSVQSSICRSVVESCSTEESSQMSNLIGNCQSKLGQDLLRMFLEEIAPDVVVEVSGRRIKAHKCILSSRCQYFAGILSGGWVESAGNVIVLPPFSFNVVQFALCHIYSGVSTIPESISIVELATLADMLGLEGLKEAIMLTLKAKYCHFFHKPCSVCIAGVLECFPLSSVYGLDDLYHRCMRWITKYFSKVWPTKAFATLPKELLDKCYQQHVVNLSSENLVDTVYGCGIIVASLQKNRWAEIVARLCRRLVNAAAHFAAARLLEVLRAIATLPAEAPPLAKQALDDCIAAAIEWAPPEQLCRSYAFLSGLVKDLRSQSYAKPDLITNGSSNKASYHSCLMFTHASSWRLQCEGALVRSAPRIVSTQAFKDLPVELRKRLRDLGCIMYGTQASLAATTAQDKKCQSPYRNHKGNVDLSRNLNIKLMRTSFVPYTAKPSKSQIDSTTVSQLNSFKNKKPSVQNPPKIRTTKAQEERARFNLSKNNQSHDRSTNKVSSRPASQINTKSSSATSKTSKESDKKLSATNKMIAKMVSSSESSRNSSPIQVRSLRSSRLKTHQSGGDRAYTMSQDSLICSRPQTAEPSSDSLGELRNGNRYATYTKTKHASAHKKGIENIIPKVQHQQEIGNQKKSKTRIPVLKHKVNSADKPTKVSQKLNQEKQASGKTHIVQLSMASFKSRKQNEGSRAPGSLMNATKSSSAKIVASTKHDKYKCKNSSGPKGSFHSGKGEESVEPPDIAVMERSGTFLKDEPTFGDKITNLDIDA